MAKPRTGFSKVSIATTRTRKPKRAPPLERAPSTMNARKNRGATRIAHPAFKEQCMSSLSISSGAFKPEATILFPGPFLVRVERELNGEGGSSSAEITGGCGVISSPHFLTLANLLVSSRARGGWRDDAQRCASLCRRKLQVLSL